MDDFREWVGVIITCAVYLVGGGIFVGVVRTAMKSLEDSLDKLGKRMDDVDKHSREDVGTKADHHARLLTLEREMGEIKNLHTLVVRGDERQAIHQKSTEKALTALTARIEGAVSTINNLARRDGALS